MIFGVDVEKWYNMMPDIPSTPSFMIPSKLLAKRQVLESVPVERTTDKLSPKDHGIDNYYASNVCFVCKRVSTRDEIVCSQCKQCPEKLLVTVSYHLHAVEHRLEVGIRCSDQIGHETKMSTMLRSD